MDSLPEMLSSVGKWVMTMDVFPVFFFGHFSIGNIAVREDSKHLGPKFRQKHPFVSWMCTVMAGLSGVFVANFLFGDPLLTVLQENFLVGYVTVIWYLLNYSPYDVAYRIIKHPVGYFTISILQEFVRLRFLYLGAKTAAELYPNAPMIIIIGGTIKGNGYGFIKVIERLIRGHWHPETNEFLNISYFAKTGFLASTLFMLHHYKIITLPIEVLYLGVQVAFITGRSVYVLSGKKDPLASLFSPICRILFGSWEEDEYSESTELNVIKNGGKKVEADAKRNGNNNNNASNSHGKSKKEKKKD